MFSEADCAAALMAMAGFSSNSGSGITTRSTSTLPLSRFTSPDSVPDTRTLGIICPS
ncbi:hypothetical protein FQZ97_1013950 [compost metagenome]